MTKGKHSHNPEKWIKNYTEEQIGNIKANFNIENILDKPITNLSISYYKNNYSISGKVGRYNFSLSNNGEYRFGFEYNHNTPFTLRNIDYCSITIWIVGEVNYTIYSESFY